MPDILEINAEIRSRIMGARATLDVYTWVGEGFIDCPRVTVSFERDGQIIQASVHFSPLIWPYVSAEYIGDWFEDEFEDVL